MRGHFAARGAVFGTYAQMRKSEGSSTEDIWMTFNKNNFDICNGMK